MKTDSGSNLGFFVHWIPLSAVALLILNDHFLKSAWPSSVTGKLSDFAGLFFFPLFLYALGRLISRMGEGFPRGPLNAWLLFLCVLVTDLIFAAIKLSPAAANLYVSVLGFVGFPSQVTADPSDLWALLMNPLTFGYTKAYGWLAS